MAEEPQTPQQCALEIAQQSAMECRGALKEALEDLEKAKKRYDEALETYEYQKVWAEGAELSLKLVEEHMKKPPA